MLLSSVTSYKRLYLFKLTGKFSQGSNSIISPDFLWKTFFTDVLTFLHPFLVPVTWNFGCRLSSRQSLKYKTFFWKFPFLTTFFPFCPLFLVTKSQFPYRHFSYCTPETAVFLVFIDQRGYIYFNMYCRGHLKVIWGHFSWFFIFCLQFD